MLNRNLSIINLIASFNFTSANGILMSKNIFDSPASKSVLLPWLETYFINSEL